MKTHRVSDWHGFQGRRPHGWTVGVAAFALLLESTGVGIAAAGFDEFVPGGQVSAYTTGDVALEHGGASFDQAESVLLSQEGGMDAEVHLYPITDSIAGHSDESVAIINRMLGEACPRWTGQVDALLLWQGNVPAVPLMVLDDPANPATILGANQIVSSVAVGPRASLMLHVDNQRAIEANYFNVGSISGTNTFTSPAGSQLAWDNLAGIPVGAINNGVATSNGAIQSFELNWRRGNCNQCLTWLAGFRWVEWNQTLAINDTFADGSTGSDVLNVSTKNNLYGAQLGLDSLLLDLYQKRVRFNGVAKAGVYGNANARATTTVGGDRIPAASFTATGKQTSFFGEIGVNGTVRLTERILWRAGYNFFWIGGVALPPQQLAKVDAAATPPTGRIDLTGSVFLQGANTGIELQW